MKHLTTEKRGNRLLTMDRIKHSWKRSHWAEVIFRISTNICNFSRLPFLPSLSDLACLVLYLSIHHWGTHIKPTFLPRTPGLGFLCSLAPLLVPTGAKVFAGCCFNHLLICLNIWSNFGNNRNRRAYASFSWMLRVSTCPLPRHPHHTHTSPRIYWDSPGQGSRSQGMWGWPLSLLVVLLAPKLSILQRKRICSPPVPPSFTKNGTVFYSTA